MFKKIWIFALTLLLGASCLLTANGKVAKADSVNNDTIYYVAFGDSIADGTALAGYSQPSNYDNRKFTEKSYTSEFKNYLAQKANVSSVQYAKAGDDSSDLLALLTENDSVKQSVANADIVTICIGGNDLLTPATNNITMLLTGGDISETFDEALVKFEANIVQITQKLNEYNPNAKYIFTTVYNPFKAFITADHDITISVSGFSSLSSTISKERLQYFGQVTEDYLSGREATAEEKEVIGINQLIANSIEQYSNMIIVDSKKVFDEYTGEYTDLINADALNYTSITTTLNTMQSDILAHLDPHPTIKGHTFLTEVHTNGFCDNFAFVTYDYNGGNVDGMNNSVDIVDKNQKLTNPESSPEKQDYIFTGWFTDSACTTAWNVENNVTGDMTLYAGYKRAKLNVTFELNGGKIDGQSTFIQQVDNNGSKAEAPSDPIKTDYIFTGWFADSACTTLWNFNNTIEDDVTLYAGYKRAKFNVTFELDGGKIDGQSTFVQQVDNNGSKAEEPSDPIKTDYIFINWFSDRECTILWNFNSIIEDDVTIYAGYKKAKFSVTFDFTGGVINKQTEIVEKVDNGSKVTQPQNPIKEDYKFTGWYTDKECSAEWDFNTVIEDDVTIYAGWIINVYFVTFNYNGGILMSASEKVNKIPIGSALGDPKLNVTKTGHLFAYWYLIDPEMPYEFGNVIDGDLTLYAKWDEAIYVNIQNVDGVYGESYKKGSTVGDLKTRITLKKTGTTFLYWSDSENGDRLSDDLELEKNRNYFAKWAQISWTNKQEGESNTSTIYRTYSPVVSKVEWAITVNSGSTVEWRVVANGTIETKFTEVTETDSSRWAFDPKEYGVGLYQIQCMVNGEQVDCDKNILVEYSIPKDINIVLNLVEGKKVYHLEISNCEYYDVSKFVWYKTVDDFSEEFTEKIGEGVSTLTYKFGADCKVCVKYLSGAEQIDGLTSNIINIKVDNYVDETTLISILVSAGVVVLVVIGVVISKKRYSDYF